MSAMAQTTDLTTPVLLMAMPQVMDPFFHRSVVLLVDHTQEGSVGFIVNRPTEHSVEEILKGLDISWRGDSEAKAYFGGPVQPQVGTVLYSAGADPAVSAVGAIEVYPGVSLTRHVGDLETLAKSPPDGGLRLFLGYAGWGSDQLMQEILRNDWLTAPVGDEFLFASKPEEVWGAALESVGVDPATLPTWTQNGGESTAN